MRCKTGIHRLTRNKYKTGTYYYKCVECTFTLAANLMAGRPTRCWRCNSIFVLNRNDTRWSRPVCQICRDKPTKVVGVDKALDELLGSIK